MEKLIITAAICGAEVTKQNNPAVPYTVEEMVREAKLAYEAGAAIIHVHVREDDGTPTQDRERFRVAMRSSSIAPAPRQIRSGRRIRITSRKTRWLRPSAPSTSERISPSR